jgi:hypothetical protein
VALRRCNAKTAIPRFRRARQLARTAMDAGARRADEQAFADG